MTRLSVIIPGYNTPDALWTRCLQSVIAACGPEDEIICVDDGSVRKPQEGPCRGGDGEKKIGVENRCTADGSSSPVDAFVSNASDGIGHSSSDAIETIASTRGGESGARGARALPGDESGALGDRGLPGDESGALIERALPRTDNSAVNLQPQIKWIYREKNGGLSAARNSGLEIAHGDYVTFVDSDDEVKSGAFSRCVEKIGKRP